MHELKEANLKMEERVTKLATKVDEMAQDLDTAQQNCLLARSICAERELDHQKRLTEKDKQLDELQRKVDTLERKMEERLGRLEQEGRKTEVAGGELEAVGDPAGENDHGREDQPEQCINPAVETEGGNVSTPNLPAPPRTSAPVPVPTSARAHSSEDWRSFRDFVTGPRNWYWLVWILVDKFVLDAIVGYYTNLGANRTSSRMDDGMAEEMAISLAKSIIEYIGNGTMTNFTLTANPTPVSDGSIRYLNPGVS